MYSAQKIIILIYTGCFVLDILRTNRWDQGTSLSPEYSFPPEGTPLYLSLRAGVFCIIQFGLQTGIDFAHFGLESGMVFEGILECMNVFVVSVPNNRKKQKRICEFEMRLGGAFLADGQFCFLPFTLFINENKSHRNWAKFTLYTGGHNTFIIPCNLLVYSLTVILFKIPPILSMESPLKEMHQVST